MIRYIRRQMNILMCMIVAGVTVMYSMVAPVYAASDEVSQYDGHDVNLTLDQIDITGSDSVDLMCKISNNTAYNLPICHVTLSMPSGSVSGYQFGLYPVGDISFTVGAPADYSASIGDTSVDIDMRDIPTGAYIEIKIPCRADVYNIPADGVMETSVKAMIEVTDPANPSWGSKSSESIPISLKGVMEVMETTPPETTSVDMETQEITQVATESEARSIGYGKEQLGTDEVGTSERLILFHTDTAEFDIGYPKLVTTYVDVPVRSKLPAVAIITSAIIGILMMLLGRYGVRFYKEHRRKFKFPENDD